MAEGVVAQVTETPKTLWHGLTKTPVLAIMIGIAVLIITLLIESFKPGLITGPIRSGLRKLGANV